LILVIDLGVDPARLTEQYIHLSMTHSQNITVLIANAEAEEVKMITIGFRAVFPGCRVETIYSADDILDWVARHEWHVVFLDEPLLQSSAMTVIPEIRKRLPKSAIILQTDRNDISTAMQAIRAGADHCFYKKSPTFSTEFPAAAKALLDKPQSPTQLEDRSAEAYLRLSEEMTEIVYELDHEGRFVNVGPGVVKLLGYTPEELIGAHFSKVIPEEERQLAEHRLNERRTGDRATRNMELRLKPKASGETPGEAVDVELTAMGRYNQQRQMMGTVGVIRDIRGHKQVIQQREQQLRQQYQQREEQLGEEYHQWEQQIEQQLQHREEELQRQYREREEQLAQEHERLKADELERRRVLQQQEKEHLQELQRREEELRQELKRKEEQLAQEQSRLETEMQKELEHQRKELQRREEELRLELLQQEERFNQEKAKVDVYLAEELKHREIQLREDYQRQVETLSQERHRLETELEQKLKQQQEQLRQDAQQQEDKLHAERQELEIELERVLQQQNHQNSCGTVLIVEPQATVLGVTRALLQQHGYVVVEAASTSEAMSICKAFKSPIHLLLTDVARPGTITLELAGRFTEIRPEMKMLFLSGYVTDSKTHADLLNRGMAFLPRPFTPDTLIRKIADIVDITDTTVVDVDSIRLSALP
jgi:PAS domain S-box-containing protein